MYLIYRVINETTEKLYLYDNSLLRHDFWFPTFVFGTAAATLNARLPLVKIADFNRVQMIIEHRANFEKQISQYSFNDFRFEEVVG